LKPIYHVDKILHIIPSCWTWHPPSSAAKTHCCYRKNETRHCCYK